MRKDLRNEYKLHDIYLNSVLKPRDNQIKDEVKARDDNKARVILHYQQIAAKELTALSKWASLPDTSK